MKPPIRIALAILAAAATTAAGAAPASGAATAGSPTYGSPTYGTAADGTATSGTATGGTAQLEASPSGLKRAVRARMRAELGGQAEASYGVADARRLQTLVEPQRLSRDRRWAFGGAVFLVPDDVHAGPVTSLFIAQRRAASGSWRVTLRGTDGFARMARRAPGSVVRDGERAPFVRTASTQAKATPIGLSLPWRQGQGWGHWGVHGNSGNPRPWNSIDFYGGDGRVLTSRAGRMYRYCVGGGQWPHIEVVHDNGYTTGYYHLRTTTDKSSGSAVELGEFLGIIDTQLPCGGRAVGDHVHWTLWSNGSGIPVQGKTIGGWTWYAGGSAYQGYAQRGSTRVYRNNCCPIVNHGGGDSIVD